ncbi:hypothetical protein RSOLAG22IIIB_00910 [Rhizoctonia solani]|uniref:Uncharacterized protein n=1 Tax=Rhizoctonia solani TaxID=456999 RepID=A0A0K6G143_9AGAM|nr:hypothetical protein RSOLAG22IIIB_00910 [Rhizoctonia solani]
MPPPACFNGCSHEGYKHQRQQSQGGRVDQAVTQPDHRPHAPLNPAGPTRNGSGSAGTSRCQSHMNQAWNQGSH